MASIDSHCFHPLRLRAELPGAVSGREFSFASTPLPAVIPTVTVAEQNVGHGNSMHCQTGQGVQNFCAGRRCAPMRSKGLGSIRREMQANRIDPPARGANHDQGADMVTDPVKSRVTKSWPPLGLSAARA